MSPLFKKLNYKNQQNIVVINAPKSFKIETDLMQPFTKIITKIITNANNTKSIAFILIFTTQLTQVEAAAIHILPKLNTDAVLWFCYPKQTSKKYTCNFNRDNGWASLAALNYQPVRMVAIDHNWSALRFKQIANMANIARN